MRRWSSKAFGFATMAALMVMSAHAQPSTAPPASTPSAPISLAPLLSELRAEARAVGVSAATFDRATRGLQPDMDVLERTKTQPEFVTPVWSYLDRLVSDNRVTQGVERMTSHGELLRAIERTYGVDRHVVLAIWGVETNFGTNLGDRSIIRSLATLAAGDERRSKYWRSELLSALRILQQGDIAPEQMVGSWAGAMGHTQFMPTTYRAYAVDFDRDGRRDIWTNIGDALASTANYLKVSGWRADEPWGFEVVLPKNFDYALSAPGRALPVADWSRFGVTRPGGVPVMDTRLPLQLTLPAGADGPAFLVTGNFRAILRYNPAVSYALAVAHLADRLAGADPIAQTWPTSSKALAKMELLEMQERLQNQGLDTGVPDGIIGNQSRAAIRAFQRTRGLPEDGYPSVQLLELLRQDAVERTE